MYRHCRIVQPPRDPSDSSGTGAVKRTRSPSAVASTRSYSNASRPVGTIRCRPVRVPRQDQVACSPMQPTTIEPSGRRSSRLVPPSKPCECRVTPPCRTPSTSSSHARRMPPAFTSLTSTWPAIGPSSISRKSVGLLAISLCGSQTAGGEIGRSLKRLGEPPDG